MKTKLKKVKVIAEMAWSHNGEIENAIKLLKGAKQANADAVGIHLTDMPTYMVENYKCSAGVTLSATSDDSDDDSIYSYLEKINLTKQEWLVFNEEAKKEEVELVVMCNDEASFEFSKELNVAHYVISAACFLEFDFVRKISEHCNNLILRIGGATLREIKDIINIILEANSNASIVLLAGVQLYPTPIGELHLGSIRSLQNIFPDERVSVGLADHIDGDDENNAQFLPCLALPFNISFIEKHITTKREDKLEDYEAALGVVEFAEFVRKIRLSELALGEGSLDYLTNDTYQKYRDVARKKVVAAKAIKCGEVVVNHMIAFKRSDDGCALDELECILGKKVTKDIAKDDGLELKDIE